MGDSSSTTIFYVHNTPMCPERSVWILPIDTKVILILFHIQSFMNDVGLGCLAFSHKHTVSFECRALFAHRVQFMSQLKFE
jgi:hypothetical protein